EFTSSVSSQTASWLDFLLNPTFANLIEQKTKLKIATENPNDIELKDNRIRASRYFAMKIAAKFNWNLFVIEKRIPVTVASDLIHCFVRLTTQTDKNYKDREQLQQLNRLDEPALFAVQLLHRWLGVNLAGYVDPLQYMRGPNENVIELVCAKMKESVQALDALLEWKSVVCIPMDACFGLIDIETGSVSCDWSRTQIYPLVECLARIAYDLGLIYFYEQNYVNAYTMFRHVHDVRNQLESTNYFSSLHGYLTSLNAINLSMEQSHLFKSKDRFLMSVPSPRTSIEIALLAEDNEMKEMTLAARHRLEDHLEVGSQQYRIVCSFNLIRSLLDGKYVSNTQYAYDFLEIALQKIKQVTPKQQLLLNSSLRIHFHNLTKNLQEQLRLNNFAHLFGLTFSIPILCSRIQQSIQRSNLIERSTSAIQFKW
ncbi:unnamed protein product, partial [Adineta steineri]